MRSSSLRCFTSLLVAFATAVPLTCSGCAARANVYDPYYHDYHAWPAEQGYYVQWETETHRDHRDFNKRSDADKKAYWDWRHNQH